MRHGSRPSRLIGHWLSGTEYRLANVAELSLRRISERAPPRCGTGDDHLHRLLHVLRRHPLEPRVEVVLAGEDVRRRQPHERQPRAVGAAANRPRSRTARPARRTASRACSATSGWRSSTSRMFRYDSSTSELDARARDSGCRLAGEVLDQRFLVLQPAVSKVADEQLHRCAFDAGLHDVRVHESLVVRRWSPATA